MAFLEALLWGAGFSLGLCVGLVAWVFLRMGTYKLLGLASDRDTTEYFNRESLNALRTRNALTLTTNAQLRRIALAIEVKNETEGD
ncbi:MAG TPA: hypothetical protein VMY37_00215 [Thermoguttaceae bacterium]|nr:hypothetical protein [Thermoguttaceae bacterium]